MFEVPFIRLGDGPASTTVLDELAAAGRLCSDVALTFRIADTLFGEASLSLDWAKLSGGLVSALVCTTYYNRKAGETARFRDGIAALYIDMAFGYCVAVRRTLHNTLAGSRTDLQVVQEALTNGCRIDAVTELLEPPPTKCRAALDECDQQVQAAYHAVLNPLAKALTAAEVENVGSLRELVADGQSDASELVLECPVPINRYAEALHFALQRAHADGAGCKTTTRS
jgi:hypothetical protein